MISVIIPAWNEADGIQRCIEVVRERDKKNQVYEIIVSDGNSTDNTVKKAREAGAKAFISPKKGRAAQMNFGAEQATQPVLYFLHADTVPPENFSTKIIEQIASGSQAGCFRLAFDDNHWLLRFYAWWTRFDLQPFRFGDQSLYVTKEVFQQCGRFNETLIVMEDNEIVKRLKKAVKFKVMPSVAITSARKYRENGIGRLQAVFSCIYLGYHLGISQESLVAFYKKHISF